MAFAKILHSLYGWRMGLTRAGSLTVDSRNVVASKYDLGAAVRFNDHFDGAALSTKYTLLKGSDGSTVNPAIRLVAGGAVRLVNGSAGAASMAVGGCQLAAARNWQANRGNLLFGASLQLGQLTNQSVFLGFTDKITLEAAFSMSVVTLTSNATDAFGFLYDDASTAKTWQCVGVANNTDGTTVDSGVTPVAATDNIFAIECDTLGNATFYIDGNVVGYMAAAVTPTVALTPTLSSWVRTTAAADTVDMDFWHMEQARA